MTANYPNLELLEYKATLGFFNNEKLKTMFVKKKGNRLFCRLDWDAIVFSQVWGSTNTAFDICEDGSPAIGGCAMTKAYTVVMHELITDIYFVFVDGNMCYCVDNVNERFLEDLKNQNLRSLSEAKEVY